ncbi:MAG TPA: outer membrane protein assembly factor BamA [Bradyrhizobium sp.]|uniref:outer membrane protein assembly factor BamA n=1 Tax=Bradyrhizobium sp. TaxID=376 RepID=UPI002D805D75|nr:outer membrane protein assembly factor BamA [Bradyrhizobium sp.]HET7885254.1 outer membrane protein assembly factor BamA [Bradyrhizobium sp.]
MALGLAAGLWSGATISAIAGDEKSGDYEERGRASVDVEGNKRVDVATVRSYFHASPDGRFDEAARDAALKALLATHLFDQVTIERKGERLLVHLREAPVLDKVVFEGNKRIKDTELSPVVESKPRGSLQRATVQADVGHIIEAYRHLGRDDVSVKPVVIDRGNDRVDLVFEVTEGGKTPVRQINFVGNTAFGKRQLAAVIKTSASNMLSFLIGGDIYDPDIINSDREAIRTYYRSKGYADANVRSVNAEYDPATKGFAITFTIDEGPLYRFGDVAIDSHVDGVEGEKLRRLLLVKDGAQFDGSALDRSNDKLSAELAKLGYPFARALPRSVRDETGRRINVTFAIEQGPRAYIERIDIHGNTRTRGYVIRREFDIGEGDAFNKGLIERAERRLKALDYFKTVKISTRQGSSPDRVILDVELQEKDTGNFNISGGYSTTDGWLAEVRLGDRSFAGTGVALNSTFTYGQFARGFEVGATDPGFFGNRASAGIDLSAKETVASNYVSYGTLNYGATMLIGTPISDELGVQWRYSIARQEITLDPASLAAPPSIVVQSAAASGPQWVSAVGDTATYSTVDNPKAPTSGFTSQLRQDLAGLGGDVRFLRTTEDFKYYHQINDDVVSLARAQGGYITGFGGSQVPLIDNFFGGPSMVRGFAPYGFGPRDLTPGTTMDNVGGSLYWATTAELQSNIPGVPAEYGLKAVAFVDAGSVFRYNGPTTFPGSTQSLQLANSNVVRSSVGAGLSWASPFGALTVTYAAPLTKASYDVVQPLGFTASPF